MKQVKNLFKSFGFTSIGLWLPITGVAMGIGSLTVLSAYIQWAGIAAVIVTVIFFVIYFLQKRKRHDCDIDYACKEIPRQDHGACSVIVKKKGKPDLSVQ